MAVYGITDVGVNVPRVSDYLKFIRDQVDTEVNETIDWDGAASRYGQLVAIMAAGLGETAQALQLNFSQNDRNAAKGRAVDNLGSYVLTPRNDSTRSTVILTLTGTAGTPIAKGKQARDVNRNVWRSTADATIGGGGTVDVEFEAVERGQITASPGQINEVYTAVSGWTSVVNADSAIPGRNRELDAAYNERQITSLAQDSANSVLSIRANLLKVDKVQAVALIENDSPETATVEGVVMSKHSVGAYIYPELADTDYLEGIAEVLWRRITSGVTQLGGQSATVVGGDGKTKTVRWDWVDPEPVNVTIAATVFSGIDTADVEARILKLLQDYFDALAVGQDVSRLSVLGLINTLNAISPTVKSAVLTINGSGSADAAITILQRAIPGTLNVTASL